VIHTGVGVYHYIRNEEADIALNKMIDEGEFDELAKDDSKT